MLINLEKSVSQIAVIERPISHYRRQTCGPIELLSAQSSASSHGGIAADKAKVIDLPPILRARIDPRVQTRSTRDDRPMLGDYASSCGSWSLYSATGNIPMALSEAIIATYMTIHMGRSPRFTQWENCASLRGVPGGSGNPAGVAFRQRKRAFVLSDEPILLAKSIVRARRARTPP